MDNKVYGVYFSPTYTNKKSVMAIASELSQNVEQIDITQKECVKQFNSDDIVVVGAPVYGGRLFKGCAERLTKLRGDKTVCIATVTYGNRDYDDALLEMCDIMSENGFVVISACALIGEHTYGQIALGRPNEVDIAQDIEFAKSVKAKLQKNDLSVVTVKGNRPYKQGGNGGGFRPSTDKEKCVNCGLCARNCPMFAIAEDNCTIDNDKCIACFRCIKSCPVGAKVMDNEVYSNFATDFTKKLSERRENEYYI